MKHAAGLYFDDLVFLTALMMSPVMYVVFKRTGRPKFLGGKAKTAATAAETTAAQIAKPATTITETTAAQATETTTGAQSAEPQSANPVTNPQTSSGKIEPTSA
jgi:hypothetical protein